MSDTFGFTSSLTLVVRDSTTEILFLQVCERAYQYRDLLQTDISNLSSYECVYHHSEFTAVSQLPQLYSY